jgi:plastocyanin
MRGRRWLTIALVGVLAVFGLGACGGGGGDKALTGLVKANEDHRFDPDEINVRFNRQATFTFQNEDKKVAHNFTLTAIFTDPDHFLTVDVAPGQTEQIKFTVSQRPRDGFLSFYCRFHQSEGMQGRIKVS